MLLRQSAACSEMPLWVMNGLISQVFPLMAEKSRSLPFVFFSVLMAAQFFVILFGLIFVTLLVSFHPVT